MGASLEWLQLDPRQLFGEQLWPDCAGGLGGRPEKGPPKNLKGQRNLLNNVLADTMVVHREEGAKEHCLFWGLEWPAHSSPVAEQWAQWPRVTSLYTALLTLCVLDQYIPSVLSPSPSLPSLTLSPLSFVASIILHLYWFYLVSAWVALSPLSHVSLVTYCSYSE